MRWRSVLNCLMQVKLYVHYKREEIVHGLCFEPMDTTSEDGSVTTIDHAKLDTIQEPALQRSSVRMPTLSRILPSMLAISQSGCRESSIRQSAQTRNSQRSRAPRSSVDLEAGLGPGPEPEVAGPCATTKTCDSTCAFTTPMTV